MNYIKNGSVLFVGEGFSWFACVFSWGWLFARGLWSYGLIFMLIEFPLWFYSFAGQAYLSTLSEDNFNLRQTYFLLPNALLLLMHFYIGIKANQWRETSLLRKDYKKIS